MQGLITCKERKHYSSFGVPQGTPIAVKKKDNIALINDRSATLVKIAARIPATLVRKGIPSQGLGNSSVVSQLRPPKC